MKKLFLLLLVLALVFSLCACKSEPSQLPDDDVSGGEEDKEEDKKEDNSTGADSSKPEVKTVVGTWCYEEEGVHVEITFNADGTGAMSVMAQSQTFTWTQEDSAIKVMVADQIGNAEYDAEADKLYLIDGVSRIEASRKDESASATDDALIGTWYATIEGVYGETTFNADGTGSASTESSSEAQAFTWSVENHATLVITMGSRKDGMSYRIEGDELILTFGGETQTFTKKNTASQGGTVDSKLVGTWGATIDGEYGEMTFNADGSGSVKAGRLSQTYTWSVNRGEIIITQENGSVNRMKYRVEGDKVYFTYENETQTFTKKNTASQGGTVDSKLVGTWGATIDGEYGEMTFYDDGNGCVTTEMFSQLYTWSVENGEIIITQENGSVNRMKYRVEGDKVYFTYENETQTFTKK